MPTAEAAAGVVALSATAEVAKIPSPTLPMALVIKPCGYSTFAAAEAGKQIVKNGTSVPTFIAPEVLVNLM